MAETTATSTPKRRVFYLRNNRKFPVSCVMSTLMDERRVAFSVSTWNPLDPFDASIGRAVAEGRLREGKCLICPNDKGVKARIIETIANNDPTNGIHYPQRARDAARRWLKKNVLSKGQNA